MNCVALQFGWLQMPLAFALVASECKNLLPATFICSFTSAQHLGHWWPSRLVMNAYLGWTLDNDMDMISCREATAACHGLASRSLTDASSNSESFYVQFPIYPVCMYGMACGFFLAAFSHSKLPFFASVRNYRLIAVLNSSSTWMGRCCGMR